MKKYIPFILFLVFTITFFYKCFFLGEVIFPASDFYTTEPFKSSEIGQKYRDEYKQKINDRNWNALAFDCALEFYPWRHYLGEAYKKGEFPKNNIYSFSGKSSFIGNGQSACFYPLNILYTIFSTPVAFTIFVILHVFLLQIFMYIYLKKLKLCDIASIFGAVAFSYCSFVINWLSLPTFVAVILWLPLLTYFMVSCFENLQNKKSYLYGALSGLCLALSFLAGHLQIAFYVSVFSLVYFIYLLIVCRKNIFVKNLFISILLFIIVFVGLGSLQIVPSLKFSQISHRHEASTEKHYNWVINNGINVNYLTNIIHPNISKNNIFNTKPGAMLKGIFFKDHFYSMSDTIEFGMYGGFATLIFAFISLLFIRKKEIIFYSIICIFFIYMACGGIVYRLFYYIPGVASFGSPCRSICIGLFGLSILGALGLNEYIKYINEKSEIILKTGSKFKTKFIIPLYGFLCVLIFNSLILNKIASQEPFILEWEAYLRDIDLNDINILIIYMLLSIILFILCNLIVKKSKKIFVLFILFLFADLFFVGFDFNETCKKEYVYPNLPIIDKIYELNGTFAVINDKWSMIRSPYTLFPPNMLMYYGIKEVGGYDSLILGSYKNELENMAGEGISPVENGNMIMIKNPFNGLENYADYILSLKELNGYKLVDKIDNVYVYKTRW